MRVLVTGGAGFIGSHVSEALLERGDEVWALDDLSTGRTDNLKTFERNPRFRFLEEDVTNSALVAPSTRRQASLAARTISSGDNSRAASGEAETRAIASREGRWASFIRAEW